jgi:fatty acid CoA ligase FadD9
VHGKGAVKISVNDLVLEKFIDAEALAAGHKAAPPVEKPENVRTVLVTGATGHLGRFLCLEWLERMAKVGGRVICIARGIDAAAARERVEAAFNTGDASLKRHFAELSNAHLEVFAGDLSEHDLGLNFTDWQLLAETVDLIVHPAALVNHVLPYASLFDPTGHHSPAKADHQRLDHRCGNVAWRWHA